MTNWIEGVEIGHCGNGYFARIDGSDVFEITNHVGFKGRKSLSIIEGCATKADAKNAALNWLHTQIKAMGQNT